MSTVETMGRNEYARHRGCAPNAVTKADRDGRISAAVVERGPEGSIKRLDWRKADQLWAANTDPAAALKNGKLPGAVPISGASVPGAGAPGAVAQGAGAPGAGAPGAADPGGESSPVVSAPLMVAKGDPADLFEATGRAVAGDATAGDATGAAVGDSRDDPHGYLAARAQREKFGAKRAELDYFERLGVLVSRDAVRAETFEILRELRDGVLLIPARVSQKCAAETDPLRIEQILLAEIRVELAKASQRFGEEAVSPLASAPVAAQS